MTANEAHRAALVIIDGLMDAEPGTPEDALLRGLSDVVDAYEKRMYPIEPITPIDAIRFRMDQMDLQQKDLIPYIGSAPKVSEVLSGKRGLSKRMIQRLHEGMSIPLSLLIQTPTP